ncbi:MFS transporter [Rhizobium alvei]|uniref:MFS transporter n=1 Tax=Rhizobium alvei TaxID=1132659 RepID=A0ABT8YTW2_9HYPH|nr:MFS transporter [Rhizobium alvei]MDO6966788.1 MFS transporter [Rhizobium alvei]
MIDSIRTVFSLLLSIFIVMTGFGVASFIVQSRALGEGWTTFDISLIGATYSAGYTLASFIAPKFIRRAGHIRVFAAFIALLSISILLCALVPDPYAWMLFRCLFGFAMAGSYMIMESWINEKATNQYRGFMFSVYMVVAMAGAITGPYIAAWGDVLTTSLFMVAAMLFSLAIFPITLTTSSSPGVPTESGFDLTGLWQRSPVAFIGSFLAGIISAAWMNFSVVYSKLSGLGETGTANMIAAVTLGSIAAQFPIGRASDLVDRRLVMSICAAIGIAASLWMASIDASSPIMLYCAAFAAGMVIFPIYSLNVAHANDLAEPGEYVRISSGITVLYGLGVIVGPLLGGQAIAFGGAAGLPLLLAATFAIYGSYAGWRILRRPA